ncbi:hypothetical protein HYDPIDRAFT_25186 [Hydnomerulius pinastri MD-312]|nr:hypothetical protein HYDPIDRAFT_25186 [Hydnomerulius pinastri MD-312]
MPHNQPAPATASTTVPGSQVNQTVDSKQFQSGNSTNGTNTGGGAASAGNNNSGGTVSGVNF